MSEKSNPEQLFLSPERSVTDSNMNDADSVKKSETEVLQAILERNPNLYITLSLETSDEQRIRTVALPLSSESRVELPLTVAAYVYQWTELRELDAL